jgi:hypothetical protein
MAVRAPQGNPRRRRLAVLVRGRDRQRAGFAHVAPFADCYFTRLPADRRHTHQPELLFVIGRDVIDVRAVGAEGRHQRITARRGEPPLRNRILDVGDDDVIVAAFRCTQNDRALLRVCVETHRQRQPVRPNDTIGAVDEIAQMNIAAGVGLVEVEQAPAAGRSACIALYSPEVGQLLVVSGCEIAAPDAQHAVPCRRVR